MTTTSRVQRNRQFLRDLFSGTFHGHGLVVQNYNQMLAIARPDTRYLFVLSGKTLDEGRRNFDWFRARCPRS